MSTRSRHRSSLRKQKGFTLISVSIAILVVAIATIGTAKVAINNSKDAAGTVVGNQLQTINAGLSAYIDTHSNALVAGAAISGFATASAPTIAELRTQNFLNSAVSVLPTRGDAYKTAITVTPAGCTNACQVTGSVQLESPISIGGGNTTDIRFISAAMNASKSSQIGFSTPTSPALITGAGWSFANPDAAKRAGILYATTFSTSEKTHFWLESKANLANLPAAGNSIGEARIARDTNKPHVWTGSSWQELYSSNSTVSMGAGSGKAGFESVMIGQGAGEVNTGQANFLGGAFAGANNQDGFHLSFFGYRAGFSNTRGSNNAAGGYRALYANTSGSYNSAWGPSSGGQITTGGYMTCIGYLSCNGATTASNSTAIGNAANVGNTSNIIRLGNNAVTSIGGFQPWSNVSDARLKYNIKTSDRGLDFIKQLRPVEYNLTAQPEKKQTGFIAQEVETADPDFPGVDSPEKTGEEFYRIAYTQFIPALVKSVQQLDARTATDSVKSSDALKSTVNFLHVMTSFLAALVVALCYFNAVLFSRLNSLKR